MEKEGFTEIVFSVHPTTHGITFQEINVLFF
jgi:hypothetical protein